jgi:hypothetical protein
MLRRDYVMRMIARAVEAIARALGLIKQGEVEPALQQIGEAYDAVLKFDRDLLDVLGTPTLVTMIGEPQLVRMVARISKLEGEIREERGEPHKALACFRRALELYGEVGVGSAAEDRDTARELSDRFTRRA